jgi:hypothetical protein
MKLEEVLPGSASVGRVVRTDPLTGTWGEPGSRRRVVLADGNSLLEEVLISQLPEMFRYEVWSFTSEAGKYAAYGIGQFQLKKAGTSTDVVWSYYFRPRGWVDAWLMRPFVTQDYHQFMTGGLMEIGVRASAAYELTKSAGSTDPSTRVADTGPCGR